MTKPEFVDDIVVLVPHRFTVFEGESAIISISPGGPPARREERRARTAAIKYQGLSLPVIDILYTDDPIDVPPPRNNTLFVVSRVTAQGLSHRADIVFPLDEVRDEDGRIIGCRALGRFRAIEESQ